MNETRIHLAARLSRRVRNFCTRLSSTNKRLLLATLLAPLAVVIVLLALVLAINLYQGLFVTGHSSAGILPLGLVIAGFAVVVAYAWTLLYGLPVYLLLRYFERAGPFWLMMAAVVPFLAVRKGFAAAQLAPFALIVSLTFWAIATPLSARGQRLRRRIAVTVVVLTMVLTAALLVVAFL